MQIFIPTSNTEVMNSPQSGSEQIPGGAQKYDKTAPNLSVEQFSFKVIFLQGRNYQTWNLRPSVPFTKPNKSCSIPGIPENLLRVLT
jgi:hypothetical protein